MSYCTYVFSDAVITPFRPPLICRYPNQIYGIVRSESDGTRWRTGGEVKGKDANGVGSQQPSTVCGNKVYTIAAQWSALLGCQQSTELKPLPI